jgi:hypothetical protein
VTEPLKQIPCPPRSGPLRMIFLGRVFEWSGCREREGSECECWKDLRPALDIDYENLVVFG